MLKTSQTFIATFTSPLMIEQIAVHKAVSSWNVLPSVITLIADHVNFTENIKKKKSIIDNEIVLH